MSEKDFDKEIFPCHSWNFSVVICSGENKKYLGVNETRDRGWWVPAGYVDPTEQFIQGGIREAKEESGIDITIKGILRVEYSPRYNYNDINPFASSSARMRVIFHCVPLNDQQKLKSIPDDESLEAKWFTVEEYKKLKKLRGLTLIEWGTYLNKNGPVFPLSLFNNENEILKKKINAKFETT